MDSIFGPRWPERRVEVVRWLEDLEPDLVCLQEVWEDHRRPNTAGWVAEHLSETWYVAFEGFALPDPEATGAHPSVRFGSAILSRWPIDTVELMAMPINPDEEDRPHVTMRVPFVPVGVPYELLHARTGGIDVYSTHLHSGTGQTAQRVEQALFIDDAIARTCDPSAARRSSARRWRKARLQRERRSSRPPGGSPRSTSFTLLPWARTSERTRP